MGARTNPTELGTDFSLYLDAVRFGAAALVVVAHLLMLGLVDGRAAVFIPNLGREAVVVFFVLSGFVISYSVDQKHSTLAEYAVARCARIYSVALPVLIASFALVALVLQFSDVAGTSGYQVARPHLYVPFHLLFLGEAWTLSEAPPWLLPYWSLGYEVWYYALFGAAFYLAGIRRLIVVGGILVLVGFKLWLLLPVWASGVYLYRWSRANAIPLWWARAGWLLSIAALCVFKMSDTDDYLRALGRETWPFPGFPLGSADRYLTDYVVCTLVLVNFACARSLRFTALRLAVKPVRALAAYTFTLYLVHFPVLMAWKSFYPHNPGSMGDLSLLVLVVAGFTYMAGFVTERRKGEFERIFGRLYQLLNRAWGAARFG